MKKSFLLLPLAAVILSACSSNNPAPVVNANDSRELSPIPVQPVPVSDNGNYGWQSEIQPTTMPALGSAPTVYDNPPIGTQSTQPTTTTKIVKKTKTVEKKVDENFQIPRDENNAPIYSQIKKGFYQGSTYTVRNHDTMYLISYIIGKDVKELARLNNMSEPYQLRTGMKLKTGNSATETITVEEKVTVPVVPKVTYQQGANGTVYASDGNITGPVKASAGVAASTNQYEQPAPTTPRIQATAATTATTPVSTPVVATEATTSTEISTPSSRAKESAPSSSLQWQWPTAGRVTAGFSASEGGNKGLDIAGNKGQDVKAAAAGKVVYAGNALEGYGNLIIIKHNDDFLSAYAHNDRILVSEQQSVSAGSKIATMGSTGTNGNKLHFEIRYQGKSVDPSYYLPKR